VHCTCWKTDNLVQKNIHVPHRYLDFTLGHFSAAPSKWIQMQFSGSTAYGIWMKWLTLEHPCPRAAFPRSPPCMLILFDIAIELGKINHQEQQKSFRGSTATAIQCDGHLWPFFIRTVNCHSLGFAFWLNYS